VGIICCSAGLECFVVEPEEPTSHSYNLGIFGDTTSVFESFVESRPDHLSDGRMHASLGLEYADRKPGIAREGRLNETLKQRHVQRILASLRVCALKLVILYLGTQLLMVTNQYCLLYRR
jgi:hypothetical protein